MVSSAVSSVMSSQDLSTMAVNLAVRECNEIADLKYFFYELIDLSVFQCGQTMVIRDQFLSNLSGWVSLGDSSQYLSVGTNEV